MIEIGSDDDLNNDEDGQDSLGHLLFDHQAITYDGNTNGYSTGIASEKQVGNSSKNIVGNLPDEHVIF